MLELSKKCCDLKELKKCFSLAIPEEGDIHSVIESGVAVGPLFLMFFS